MTKNNTPSKSKNNQQLKDLIEEQRKEIEKLKGQVETLTKSVDGLNYELTILKTKQEVSSHVNSVLERQVDDLQQYSRRYSIILDNVPAKKNEKNEDLEREVKDILIKNFKLEAKCLDSEFDKTHRIGKVNKDNNQPIIVRFKSHSFRSNLYVDRKNHQGKRGSNYKLRVALTSKRRKLLAEVKNRVKDVNEVDFAYASVNGDIKVRLVDGIDGKVVFDIRNDNEIDELLAKI